MSTLKKTSSSLYNQFKMDIWGVYARNNPYGGFPDVARLLTSLFLGKMYNSWVWRFNKNLKNVYIYRLDITSPGGSGGKINYNPLKVSMLQYFYLYLNPKKMRSITNYASSREGSFEEYFFLGMEGRMSYMLYSTNFLGNIFELKSYVFQGMATVNGKRVAHPNHMVHPFELVQVTNYYYKWVSYYIIFSFKERLMYFNTPSYLGMNYTFLFGFMKSQPSLRDFAYTNSYMDVYKAMDFL